jgi:hypothetical protein
MPVYHLHVRGPKGIVYDKEGIDYADRAAAVVEAIKGARCLMRGEVAQGTLCLDQSIEIHDATGQHVTTVPFNEALSVIQDGASAPANRTLES